MPGIFGIISKRPKEINEEELSVMSKSVHMEVFYNSGFMFLPDMSTYVGWTCHEGSFSDCLPITNEKEDIILFYCGENFMDMWEIDRLKGRNHKFNKMNASYIVHMYEEWGENFVEMLNGRHHGILIDKRNKKTVLFNDRYGLQRIYYFESEDAFYFASEAKAILKICPQLRQIDMVSLAELFLYNCVLGNRSLFKNIHFLPNASFWIFYGNNKADNKVCYFQHSDLEGQPLLEKEFHYERLRYVFQKVIERYHRAEDKIGVYLTGDLDNSIILANAKYGRGKLPCYTLCSRVKDTDHVKAIQNIAATIDQTLQVITLNKEFIEIFPDLAEKAIFISDGNTSVTDSAELYLNIAGRVIAPIKLSGNYGGAIIRKNRLIHINNFNRTVFNMEFQNKLTEVYGTHRKFSKASLTDNLNNGIPWAGYGKLSIEQSQLIVRTPFTDNDFVKLMYRAPDEVMDSDEISIRLIKDGNQRLAKITAVLTETSSIAHTFRKLFKGFIGNFETNMCGRGVLGQPQLDGTWFRNELSHYVKEILLDTRAINRQYINKHSLELIIAAHTSGTQNYMNEINFLLTAELIHRLFIDH